ncbi:MAG: hypothetical protein K8T26_10525 [Lentisphaerae bacterium]|nr:hypothetical protein [Lentisphaerota bacterium]
MHALLPILLSILGIAVVLILPLKLAGAAVGARRTGAGWCFLALMAASVAHTIGLSFPWFGSLIAFLLAAAMFAAILDTTFMRGIAVAVLHAIFSVVLVLVLVAVFGLSLSAL